MCDLNEKLITNQKYLLATQNLAVIRTGDCFMLHLSDEIRSSGVTVVVREGALQILCCVACIAAWVAGLVAACVASWVACLSACWWHCCCWWNCSCVPSWVPCSVPTWVPCSVPCVSQFIFINFCGFIFFYSSSSINGEEANKEHQTSHHSEWMTMIDGYGYDHVAFISSDEGEISGNKVLYVIFRLNSMKM